MQNRIINTAVMAEVAISSHIHPLVVEDRYEIVLNKMEQILLK